MGITVFSAVSPITLAQFTPEMMNEAARMVVQSGFNALLVLLLLYFGRNELREMAKQREENNRNLEQAIHKCAKGVTLAVLAMQWLPPQFHKDAREINEDMHDIEHERKG